MSEPVRFQHFEVPLREDGSLFELGRGAMGITYKAFDTNLRCFVALKVINAAYLSSEVAKQRFLREARAAAALRHPNVATVFHLGEEEGNCFYAMEYVDGETVEAKMKREGEIPPAMALEIVAQVARALGAAEKQGLVHRDIKPSNLMLVREDDHEFTVKVIDFGLAKSSAGGNEDAATLTVGGFLGTPHFASPEQLEEREIDIRSDIYSLGVTLYYMLAGRAPFSGSLAQVMSQHLHREPPLDTLTGHSPQVVTLLRHMLAKDASARPQSAAELRREVEACLAGLKSGEKTSGSSQPVGQETFETQALDETALPPITGPVPGEEFAGRYRITSETRASDFGKVFRAELDGSPLALLVLDPSLVATRASCTRIEEEVAAIQRIDSPAIQKIHSIERLENISFLTLDWVEGSVLLDLLRTRKALPPAEALAILRPLADGFAALQAAGLPCPDLSAHEVFLSGVEGGVVGTDVGVRFNAFSPRAAVVSPDATLVTSPLAMLRESGSLGADEGRCYVFALASLAYEMLGGVKSGSTPVPIPGLPEEANAALRRALGPSVSFASLAEFLSVFEAACGRVIAPTATLPVASDPSPPPLPPAKKRGVPVLAVGAVGVLLVLGATAAFFVIPAMADRRSASASPTPAPQATPSSTPEAVAAATPEATPEVVATPAPTPGTDPVIEGIAAARQTASEDLAAALVALLELSKAHPDRSEAREAVREFVSAVRDRGETLTPGQSAALREPLEAAAAMDIVDAQVLLGEELRDSDPKGSLKWTLAAAKNGNPDAMLLSGLMLSNGTGTGAPDLREAAVWFQQAAAAGNPRAMVALGECYLLSKGVTRDPRLAMEWLNKAAAQNDVLALDKLGDIHKKGIPGVVQPDFKKAFAYFSSAKDLGYLPAFSNLGALFMSAPEGMKDEKMAVGLFREGAEKGDARSAYFYALCLSEGHGGLEKDPAAARTWYVTAAEGGDASAQAWCKKNDVPFTPVPAPQH